VINPGRLRGSKTETGGHGVVGTVTVHQQFARDIELIDEICAAGERFSKTLR